MNFALIGDIHSDSRKLELALNHCSKNRLFPVILGDIFDSRISFSDSVGVYRLIKDYQTMDTSLVCIHSNHLDKLQRHLLGNNVMLNNGLERTIEDFENSSVSMMELLSFVVHLPYGIVFKDSRNLEYRCAHAYFPSSLQIGDYTDYHLVRTVTKKDKNKFLYGPTRRPDNSRVEWWKENHQKEWIRVAGHYHIIVNDKDTKSLVLDGCCGSEEDDGFLALYDVENQELLKF
jgi:hypothetical protein